MKKVKNDLRQKFLVNPGFQVPFLSMFIFLFVMIVAVFYGSEYYFFWQLKELASTLHLPPDHPYVEFLHSQQTQMHVIFLTTVLVCLLTIVIFGMVLSNKIAGPIVRFCEYLDKTQDLDEMVRFHPRDGDSFPEIYESFNDFCRRVQEKHHRQHKKDRNAV